MRTIVPAMLAASLTLSPAVAVAETLYVSTTGDDGAAGTEDQPFRTLAKGIGVLAAGDVLLVREGTYDEELAAFEGGTSWEAPVTIAAYPGEKPVLRPGPGATRVMTFASASASFIVVDGLVLDAENVEHDAVKITWSSGGGASHHVRLVRCEIMNAPRQGVLVSGDASAAGLDVTGNELVDLDVHDNGTTDFDHGLYISTSNNLVDGCRVHDNAGWGVHVFHEGAAIAGDNVVRNSFAYDNARAGRRGAGIGLYSGSGSLAYNNVVWGNRLGLALGIGLEGALVAHNVAHDNDEAGIYVDDASTSLVLKNNVAWQTGVPIDDNGAGTALEANVVDVDPGFVDADARDYHLLPASPCVDQGVAVPEVDVDLEGTARPQGRAADVGAYELLEAGAGGSTSAAAGTGTGATGTVPIEDEPAPVVVDDAGGGCACRVTPARAPAPVAPVALLAAGVACSIIRRRGAGGWSRRAGSRSS